MKLLLPLVLLTLSIHLIACTRVHVTYYMPSGPGKTSIDDYSYELTHKAKIHLKFAQETFSKILALRMHVDNPRGASIKFVSNDFVFFSSSLKKPVCIKADYLYVLHYFKGTESERSIYNEIVEKWSTIVVRTDLVDIADLEIELPQLSINGKIIEIPNVKFNKKEGTFWAIINR